MAVPRFSRRQVWTGLVTSLLGVLGGAWLRLGGERRDRQRATQLVLPRPTGDGVSFHGDVVLVQEQGVVRAYLARCPHLGCRIDRARDATLVCPCHGSRFDLHGARLQGPATAGLRSLAVEPAGEGTLSVVLPA